MHHFKKNIFPVFLFLILLFFFGGRSYACVSDDISTERVESHHQMKLISGIISILGEGTLISNKDSLDFPDDIFNTFNPFCKISISSTQVYYYVFDKPNHLLRYEIPLGKNVPVFISNLSLLI